MKNFKIKFSDFNCEKCSNRLYVKDIYRKLQEQYEPDSDESGYLAILISECQCGQKYKIYCECHEMNGVVTVCISKLINV